eukprot:403345107
MPSVLKAESQNIYMYMMIILSCAGAAESAFNFNLIFNPNGRFSNTSPATSAWAGVALVYHSLIAYLGLKKLYNQSVTRLEGMLYIYKIRTCRFIFQAEQVFVGAAAFSLAFGSTPDYSGCFWILLNLIPLYFHVQLMYEETLNKLDKQDDGLPQPNDTQVLIEIETETGKQLINDFKRAQKQSCFWTLLGIIAPAKIHTIFNVALILTCIQPSYEYITTPDGLRFEKYVTVKTASYDVKLRTLCMGELSADRPSILFEVGGGSSGIDVYGLQKKLARDYFVCSYDRAGYGKSQQGPFPQSEENTMDQVVAAMTEVKMPIQSEKSVIVWSLSGGQLCRYYAKNLKSIKAIILLDSMPVQNWFQVYGQALGQSAEEIHKSQLQDILKVQAISAVWPLFVGTQIIQNGAGFLPQEMQSWSKWQIRTVKNWYAQSLGEYNQVHSCDLTCANSTIVKPENVINVPVYAIIASNSSITCEDRNYSGETCKEYIAGRDAAIKLNQDQVKLSTIQEQSALEMCDGICDHDFVWMKVDYLYSKISAYLQKL